MAGTSESAFDLVVVGAGVAGWTAARRAQQLGARVVVLEKFHAAPGFGNGRLSGGWFHAAMKNPAEPPDELYEAIVARAAGFSRPELARAWADNVGRALSFLRSEGGTFEKIDLDEDSRRHYPPSMTGNVLMPPRPPVLGRHFADAGPDRLLRSMHRRLVDAGGAFLPAHRADGLVRDGGRVVGVRAQGPRQQIVVRAAAVLLADGGFQANPELVREHITSCYKLRGSPSDTGDALVMGQEAGAKTVNMAWFYGYPLHRDSLFDDRLWPAPSPGGLIEHGVVLDADGNRFVDEGIREEQLADAIAQSSSPGGCWVIFDHETWSDVGRRGGALAINPTLTSVGATVEVASTLGELARKAQLPDQTVVATVGELNDWAHGRRGPSAGPFRTGRPPTIEQGPFYAVPLVAGITFTMGGLLVDRHGRVLDEDERAIPGLYAAGGTMGGLQGGPGSAGYTGGWSEASTFGLLVAEHAAGGRR